MRPSWCHTDRKRSQSPASRHSAQFSIRSLISSRSDMSIPRYFVSGVVSLHLGFVSKRERPDEGNELFPHNHPEQTHKGDRRRGGRPDFEKSVADSNQDANAEGNEISLHCSASF